MSQHERMQPIIPRNKRKNTSTITIALSILFSVILPITHAGQFSSYIERPPLANLSDDIDRESLNKDIRTESRIEQRSGFDFERSCLDPLQVADNNDDSVLTVDEYAAFVKELSVELDLPELFIDVTDYTSLPLPFNANLNILTCDTCKTIYEDNTDLCCMSNNSLNMINIYKQNRDIVGAHRFWLYTICIQTIELIKEMTPSAMPSAKPSIAGSQAPSISAAPSPVPTVSIIVADALFYLSNREDLDAQAIINNSERMDAIEDAFQKVVNIALENVNNSLVRRLRLRGSTDQRILVVEVQLEDTNASDITDYDCPSTVPDTETHCQSVAGEAAFRVEGLDNQSAKEQVEDAIQSAISENADLFSEIGYLVWTPTGEPSISPPILNPTAPSPRVVPIENQPLGVEAIAAIACGAVALGLFAAASLFISKRRERKARGRLDDIESTFVANNTRVEKGGGHGSRGSRNVTLGASSPNYGTKHKVRVAVGDFSSLSDADDQDSSTIGTNDLRKLPLESSLDSSLESSSNAGSSGWSSSAGMSSLHTNSVDSVELGYRPNLKRITKQSGYHKKYPDQDNRSQPYGIIDDETSKSSKSSKGSNPSDPNEDILPDPSEMNKIKLDNAIKAEDWIAVGATAALLANSETTSASNSQSTLTSHGTHSRSGGNSVHRARCAELDNLVAANDWAGVVLAAAKYEVDSHGGSTNGSISTGGSSSDGGPAGEDSSYASANPSSVGDTSGSYAYASASEGVTRGSNCSLNSSRSHATGSRSLGSHSGTSSRPSTGTGTGYESPSKIQRRQEIRLEVEELVGRVVPEEAANVDEMMRQFRGREEELVETLRTMQERSIAQREREEMRRNAKREARKSVRKSGKGVQGVGGGDLGKSLHGSLHGSRHGVATRNGLPPTGPRALGKRTDPISPTSAGLGATAAAIARRRQIVKVDNITSANSSVSEMSNNSRSNRVPVPQRHEQSSKRYSPSSATADSSKISYNDRIEIDRAIENGDWDALGVAAAKLGEGSVSSAGVSDFGSLDSSTIFSDERESMAGGSKISSIITRSDAGSTHNQRAMELERLIQKGDWQSVVVAAGKFSAADRHSIIEGGSPHTDNSATQDLQSRGASGGSISSSGWRIPFFSGESKISQNTETDGERKSRKTSKEEEDALAQAEIWMTIAKQSKNEGAKGAKGASNAADWAISRSLKALQNAEQQQTTIKTTIKNDNPAQDTGNAPANNASASSRRRNQRSKRSGGSRSIGSSDGESF